ncbi:hypothetical protein DEO72_LG3g698 [Vigna unguiculata]|uniref:Uncharacterized protein n=1 Tax=Vigna unguiculata TaxID=3917 RepID=A0A4D6LCA2_VIGUN|nr:hypothetical protein DEO72_LG3g698 [Vigna unguiculata]
MEDGAKVGEDGGIGAAPEVDVEVGIGAAPMVDVEVGIEGGAKVGEDGRIGTTMAVDVEDGIGSGAEVVKDGAIGVGLEVDGGAEVGEVDGIGTGTKYGVEGENKFAEEVGLEGGAEVFEEELSKGSSDSDDDFDVHSWKESEEELSSADVVEDGLFDVTIGGDDAVEDDLFKVRIKEGKVGEVKAYREKLSFKRGLILNP